VNKGRAGVWFAHEFWEPSRNCLRAQAVSGRFDKQLERRKAASGLNGQYASSPHFFYCVHESEASGHGSVFFEKKWVFLQNYSDAGFHAGVFFVLGGCVPLNKLVELLH